MQLPATSSERSAQSRSRAAEIADYAAIASRIAAREVDGHDHNEIPPEGRRRGAVAESKRRFQREPQYASVAPRRSGTTDESAAPTRPSRGGAGARRRTTRGGYSQTAESTTCRPEITRSVSARLQARAFRRIVAGAAVSLGRCAVRTIRDPAALFEVLPMDTSHRRSAGRGSVRGSVRRLPRRVQTAVVNRRYDLGSPSVRTHSSAIGDTTRRAFPQGKWDVSDRRRVVAHRVPNSLTKDRTTVRV